MDLAAKRRPGQGWKRLERPRPGGRRDGRILRFAEADTDLIRLCAFNTALARKGLAVFNRSAHSAGPGLFMQWCEDAVG